MRSPLLALACTVLLPQSSLGASVTFSLANRPPSAAEIAGAPELVGMTVWDLFLTSSGDVLSINEVTITLNGTTNGSLLYQNATGSDVEPPNPLFVQVFPALGADSWITTPGGTSSAGGGFSSPAATWFDSDNNGPQSQFQFARLTFSGTAVGSIVGNVAIPSDDGLTVVNIPINFVPEPACAYLGCMGFLALVALRRHK
jgi:hypothetical protein